MFVIIVYDVGEKRVAKALKTCRKYLNWVQNSVLKKLKAEMEKLIDETEDSVILYTWRTQKYSDREIIGLEKGGISNII